MDLRDMFGFSKKKEGEVKVFPLLLDGNKEFHIPYDNGYYVKISSSREGKKEVWYKKSRGPYRLIRGGFDNILMAQDAAEEYLNYVIPDNKQAIMGINLREHGWLEEHVLGGTTVGSRNVPLPDTSKLYSKGD